MMLLMWMTVLFVVKDCLCNLEPKLYNFERECENAIDFQPWSYIGVDEQVQIKTSPEDTDLPYITSCYYTLRSMSGDRFMFYFKELDMEDNGCANDWLTFYDGDVNYLGYIGERRYCGQTKPIDVFVSSGNEMTIRFNSDGSLNGTGFDIIVTVFHEGSCASFETECSNGRCIHADLGCNGYNPCGDYSDCDGGSSEGTYLGVIIGGALSGFVVIVVIVTIIAYVTFRRRRSTGKQGHVEHPPTAVFQTPEAYQQNHA